MNIFSVSSLSAFVICEALAAAVYVKNPADKVNKAFALETAFIGIWTLFPFVTNSAPSPDDALYLARLTYIGAILVPPSFLYFVYHLIGRSYSPREKYSLALVYFASCFFLAFAFSPSFITGLRTGGPQAAIVPGAAYHLFFLFFAVTISLGYVRIFLKFRRVRGAKRNQLGYVLVAFVIAGVSGIIHFLSAYGVEEVYPHDFLVILFTALISYAIVKYRAMDINVAFKKTMAYSLAVGLLTGLFVALVLLLSKTLAEVAGVSELSIQIFAAITIALLFTPLKNKIQTFVDRLFSKSAYDYYAVIQKVGHELSSKIYLKDIQQIVVDLMFSTLKVKEAYFLGTGKKGFFAVYYHKTKRPLAADEKAPRPWLKAEAELVRLLQETREVAVIEELPALVGPQRAALIAQEAAPFQGEVAVPICIDGELKAMMLLGGKISEDPFTDADLNLLRTVANDASLSLKSALLYAEKLRSERLATLGATAATLAHEIKNPLSSIKTFSQLLQEKYGDDEFRQTFSEIVPSEIERIDRLVTELLTFAKKAPSRAEAEKVDMLSLLEECLKQLSEQLRKEEIAVVREFGPPFSLAGDRDRLKQALLNILSNSYQAMEGGGTLKISSHSSNNKVTVAIEDTGVGISENDLEKIFDPFFTTKSMGNGLGLTISRKIIEEHGGSINVSSKQGEGTVFALSFELAEVFRGDGATVEQPRLWN